MILQPGAIIGRNSVPDDWINTLYYGDNLAVLREHIADGSVDLIYLDPPFKSNQNYNVLFKEQDGSRAASQIQAFEDTWRWDQAAAAAFEEGVTGGQTRVSQALTAFRMMLGTNDMLAYLSMMALRLVELRRVLKPTGSIYLHCDPAASHYLKLLMDAVFQAGNFRSEIVWRRTNAHNKLAKQFGPIHDTILFYSKSESFVFHPGRRPYTKQYIEDRFTKHDELGRYQTNYLTGPGTRAGESGLPWRGFDPTSVGRHWAIPGSLREFLPDDYQSLTQHEQLEHLYEQDLIVFPRKEGGQPMYKQYIGQGVPYQDIWAYQANTSGVLFESDECIDEDVKYLEDEAEKLGYATQKPEGLLYRIIESSANEDAVVLDPFCGCGTAIAAAQAFGLKWVGIDLTHLAVSLMKQRLKDSFGIEAGKDYRVVGEPADISGARQLAKEDTYQFQWWALGLVGARPYEKKKGSDRGIDGRLFWVEDAQGGKTQHLIISVKSGKTGPDHVRDLAGTINREQAAIGVLLSLNEPTKEMRAEAAAAGFYAAWGRQFSRLQLLTITDLLEGKRVEYPPGAAGNISLKRAAKATRPGPVSGEIPGMEWNPQLRKKNGGRNGRC